MLGMMNGFVLTATGDATYELADLVPSSAPWIWDCLGGILFTSYISFPPPDSFCVGLACMPPFGIPIISPEERYFTLYLNIGPGEPGSMTFKPLK